MKRVFLFIIALITCTAGVRAQDDVQLSQYFLGMGYYNPAYAGTTGDLNMLGFFRQQWIGMPQAGTSFFVIADMPLTFGKTNHGVGLVVNTESIGLFTNTKVAVQYAYKQKLFGGTLSIGLQGGIFNKGFDGTKVYINSDSKLRYPKKFALNTREVYLEGEAYFVVAKNKNRPFIVNLSGPAIHVLGTSFNVQDYPENKDIVVCLDEGNINLTLPTEKKYPVQPGERLVYNKDNQQCTISKMNDMQRLSMWKQNVIVFKDTPLPEVIKILNRWYNVEFKVEDENVLKYVYTLTSDNTLLEKVLMDLEKIAPVKFEYNEDKKEVIVKMK